MQTRAAFHATKSIRNCCLQKETKRIEQNCDSNTRPIKLYNCKQRQSTIMNNPETFSFLVTTDNHMGFKKNDNLRRKDSFMAFAEALKISRDRDVDFVLLGGDLFHENRPSASIEHKCIKIIRQHMNSNSTRKTSFKRIGGKFSHFHKVNHANFEDPNFTIPHPIMTIHGNHDDPTGPDSQSICEKLATCGLLNYFGGVDSMQDIVVEPILLQKGDVKLALYGLGFIPDHKLKLAFDKGQIVFKEPPEDTYNILVIHQNRVPHNREKLIEDDLLPTFFHLVIRGHEHDTQSPEFLPYSKVEGLVYQPGSTVATSITPGEVRPKQVGLFQIRVAQPDGDRKTRYKAEYELIELKCCRRMLMKDITQKSIFKCIKTSTGNTRVTAAEFKTMSQQFVEQTIDDMLVEYEDELASRKAEQSKLEPKVDESGVCDKLFKMERFDLPLVRVRIEYTSKNQRFNEEDVGNKLYPGRVANKDVILFKKQKLKETSDGTMENTTFSVGDSQENDIDDDEPDEFDVIDLSEQKNLTIDAMIENYFQFKLPHERLQALSLTEYTSAVNGSMEEGNVISTVLTKMKRDIFEQYKRAVANDDVAFSQFYDIQRVEDWFMATLQARNSESKLGGDEPMDEIEFID